MKHAFRFTILTILCLTATSAVGDITIDTPSEPLPAGQNIQIFVEGIEPDELSKAIATHWPREQTMFVAAKTWGNKPFIWFQARLPGKYLIEITVPRLVDGKATLDHAEAVVVVGGEPEPSPNPTPPVPVPPVPVPDQVSMRVILETGTRTASESMMLAKLMAYRRTSGIDLQFVDQDQVSGLTDKRPEWLKPYLTAIATRPVTLPVLIVLTATAQTPPSKSTPSSGTPQAYSVVAVKEIRSGEQAIALVKKYGGKP